MHRELTSVSDSGTSDPSTRSHRRSGFLLVGAGLAQGVGLILLRGMSPVVAGGALVLVSAFSLGVGALWHRSRHFARDVMLVTACIGGLGMLLGTVIDTRPIEGGQGSEPGTVSPKGSSPEGRSSSRTSEPGSAAEPAHSESGHGQHRLEQHRLEKRGLEQRGSPSHGPGHHDPALVSGLAFLGSWMCLLMLIFCVPACFLLCGNPSSADPSRPRERVFCVRGWIVHGLCSIGMLLGMTVGMLALGAIGGHGRFGSAVASGVVIHHLAMLVGMVAGAGIVARGLSPRLPSPIPHTISSTYESL